jgi:predicted PurR-regulated permease PerM
LTNTLIKHWRLVALVLGIIVFIWVLYLVRTFILPFAIGLVLAYLMMPLVSWLEKSLPPRNRWPGFKRVFSVVVSFIVLLAIIGGFFYVVVTAVIDASVKLIESAPYFIGQSVLQVQEWIDNIISKLPVEMQEELTQEVIEGGISLGKTIRTTLMGAVSSIPGTFNLILGFAVLPFFLFYILKDSEKLKRGLSSALPENIVWHGRNVVNIIENVLGRYIRAQLMLGLIVGYFTFVGLLILDVPFPLALALLAGVGELIPTLGPWLAGAVAAIVALAMAPEKTIWVVILYLAIQLVENNLMVPKIQSAYLRIHPAVMIVLLVFGAYVAGFWGILLIGPVVATLVEIFKYIREHYHPQPPPESLEPPPPPEPAETP